MLHSIKHLVLKIIIILFIYISLPISIRAQTTFQFYLNDFYSKRDRAIQILNEIEINLKKGNKNQVCSKQRKAAKLGILANQSLIKAFQILGSNPPMEEIKSSQNRWESILNNC